MQFLLVVDFDIAGIMILGGGAIITLTWSIVKGMINRFVKDCDTKFDKLDRGIKENKEEHDITNKAINRHLEATDTRVDTLRADCNDLKLNVVKQMGEMELRIVDKINELSLKIERYSNNKQN